MIFFGILLVLVLVLVLSFFIALWFYEVAKEKGHHDNKYFWICFWLGIIGWLLIVALPDRAEKISSATAEKRSNAPADSDVPGFTSGAMNIPKRKYSEEER